MALRTFRSNPSLGGFGSESTSHRHLFLGGNDKDNSNDDDHVVADCDAFAQIVKELVDNAVDACGMPGDEETNNTNKSKKKKSKAKDATGPTMTTQHKRVRVVIETFSPPMARENNNNDNEEQATTAADSTTEKPRELLRVTVSDNGCGMPNIQDCVEAFKSSKANNNNNNRTSTGGTSNEQPQQQQQAMTAGRYGIGLTLCLLHAQRLVPHSCASITSATASASHFTKASYVVDTEGDSVRCVELKTLPKTFAEESGTSVSLLVPGGATAQWAWPRLAEYFARFRLSCGVPCSLQVMAATLAKAPLFVRPPLEERNRRQQQQQQRQEQEEEQRLLEQAHHQKAEDDDDDETEWGDVFDDDDNPDDQQTIAEEETDSASQQRVVTPPNIQAPTKRLNNAVLQKEEQEQHRQEMHRAVELYLGHAVELANVAISRQPIRIGTGGTSTTTPKKRQRGKNKDKAGPSLEVTFVVCGVTEDDEREEDDDLQEVPPSSSSSSSNMATMMMVRMVNRIPLLDGAEASSCGLVQGLMQKKKVWNSFGLDVSSNGLLGLSSSRDCYTNDSASMVLAKLPTFQVKDNEQVAPFLKSAKHALFEDPFENEDDSEEDEQDSDADLEDVEELATRRRKRKRKKSRKWLLPAGIRLGKILVVVQIDAEPCSLPLPTLSKGRLPMDNLAIDKALEVALLECLRSLQKTNPDLLLTAQQLKRAERDARYVPAVAASIASIIAKSTDSSFQNSMTSLIRQWGIGGVHNERGEAEIENGNDEANEAATVASHRTTSSGGSETRRALSHDAHDLEGEAEGDASVADGNSTSSQPPPPSGKELQKLVRELGGNVETRLRQVLSSHEEASEMAKKAKKKKPKKAKGGDDDSTKKSSKSAKNTKGANGNDYDSDDDKSILSYDFSASSKEPSEQGSPAKSRLEVDDEASLPQAQPPIDNVQKGDTHDIFEDDDDWWPN